MSKVDRRILKSQEAIKKALIELMSEKHFDNITIQDISEKANVNRGTIYLHYLDKYDLLDKLIEEHINELRKMCESACELDWIDATLIFCEHFERNYSFFSMMLASKGAPYFRNRFLGFLLEEFRKEVDVTKGKNQGLNEDVIVRFVSSAYVEVVEWWFMNGKPFPHQVLAEQLGTLLERNL
ncbi:TetR/AcrR family transcriptional regulator [Aneurinibacillus sp. Ricciae_BoGa-3]|uniref:TetR/AcrR family transcriptional regulator n=1 Tax=Aneurinibacillus sp. Ricciae_BoGa-3 TaxID=3022697 RepID=UPI0023407EE6|nr:TetR/AcrR family transcriptional regulator [Aneurinibacillus sp. Ricciae_BoGa-3]WCK55041.1 TetR/AcrR family transcriptional regulator [Aneurinibacillus sp. Ricciae_BoGa-3]